MPKYITVKLTKNQVDYILDKLPPVWEELHSEEEAAFNSRLKTKLIKLLAKAKIS